MHEQHSGVIRRIAMRRTSLTVAGAAPELSAGQTHRLPSFTLCEKREPEAGVKSRDFADKRQPPWLTALNAALA
tara:strand:+ start:1399 stop:1620 length:222 start_codon:yes stop_codon:yes gene_type:complete